MKVEDQLAQFTQVELMNQLNHEVRGAIFVTGEGADDRTMKQIPLEVNCTGNKKLKSGECSTDPCEKTVIKECKDMEKCTQTCTKFADWRKTWGLNVPLFTHQCQNECGRMQYKVYSAARATEWSADKSVQKANDRCISETVKSNNKKSQLLGENSSVQILRRRKKSKRKGGTKTGRKSKSTPKSKSADFANLQDLCKKIDRQTKSMQCHLHGHHGGKKWCQPDYNIGQGSKECLNCQHRKCAKNFHASKCWKCNIINSGDSLGFLCTNLDDVDNPNNSTVCKSGLTDETNQRWNDALVRKVSDLPLGKTLVKLVKIAKEGGRGNKKIKKEGGKKKIKKSQLLGEDATVGARVEAGGGRRRRKKSQKKSKEESFEEKKTKLRKQCRTRSAAGAAKRVTYSDSDSAKRVTERVGVTVRPFPLFKEIICHKDRQQNQVCSSKKATPCAHNNTDTNKCHPSQDVLIATKAF